MTMSFEFDSLTELTHRIQEKESTMSLADISRRGFVSILVGATLAPKKSLAEIAGSPPHLPKNIVEPIIIDRAVRITLVDLELGDVSEPTISMNWRFYDNVFENMDDVSLQANRRSVVSCLRLVCDDLPLLSAVADFESGAVELCEGDRVNFFSARVCSFGGIRLSLLGPRDLDLRSAVKQYLEGK